MPQTEKGICPICHQAREGEKCCTCRANSPRPAVWPPAPQQATVISSEGDKSVNGWRDNFALGLALGFVCHVALMIPIWTTGFEFGKKYMWKYPHSIQEVIFYGMIFAPTLPAIISALIPVSRGKKFSYGMLVGSGIGLLIWYLVAAILAGWFPFD